MHTQDDAFVLANNLELPAHRLAINELAAAILNHF
jgi:hypothetical protein